MYSGPDRLIEAPPSLDKFLDTALPRQFGNHTLAIGDDHTITQHFDYLRHHLPSLKMDHNLGMIGLECSFYLNVFLWAYQDGKLPVKKSEEIRDYMRTVFEADTRPKFKNWASASADLAMAAIDSGVRVFTYDARNNLFGAAGSRHDLISYRPDWFGGWLRHSPVHDQPIETVKQKLREDSALRESFFDAAGHNPFLDSQASEWMIGEVHQLLHDHPEYMRRFRVLEDIRDEAKKREFPKDAIHAILFDAARIPGHNSIAISGTAHISGTNTANIDKSHSKGGEGILADCLASTYQGEKPVISKAILAGTGTKEWLNGLWDEFTGITIQTDPFYVVPFDEKGGVTVLSQPDHIQQKLPAFGDVFKLANPMFIPKIARAVKRLGEMLNGESRGPSCV
jgi:hypothetical protein